MRIAGTNIPDNKRIEIALTYVFGIGRHSAVKILKSAKVDLSKRAKALSGEEINRIQSFMEKNYKTEGELRQIIKQHIGLMKELQSHKGMRHSRGLPVRGQRTKTNSRTVRGNVRKTAGSGKRKVELK